MVGTFTLNMDIAKGLIAEYVRARHGFDEQVFKVEVKYDEADSLFRVEVSAKDTP